VAPPLPAGPTHAARPVPPRARRLAAVGAVLLLIAGAVIAAQMTPGSPVRSNPPSAEHMKTDTPGSVASSPRRP
jgi:hypothetical protein